MCLKVYKLGPAKFLSAPRLAWQAALKKNIVKLDLLIDFDMLLMVEKLYLLIWKSYQQLHERL